MKIKIKTNNKNRHGFIPRLLEAPKKEGFITKFIKVIVDDINFKFRGIKSEDRERWEDYERFCELARGNK